MPETIEGEIVVSGDMNKYEAEEQFKLLDEGLTDIETAKEQIQAAAESIVNGRGWVALGFKSFAEACNVLLKSHIDKLSQGAKHDLVSVLSAAGLSQRMISAATEIPKDTVRRQLAQNAPVAPKKTVGADGRARTSTPKKAAAKPGPDAAQMKRLRSLVLEARSEGFAPEDIHKMLTPSVTQVEINAILKEAKVAGTVFDPPLENLIAVPPVNWQTGEGCEDGWASPPVPKVDMFQQDYVNPAKQYIAFLRQKRTLNASGHQVLYYPDYDLTELVGVVGELSDYFDMWKEVLTNKATAEAASKVIGTGTEAEKALQ